MKKEASGKKSLRWLWITIAVVVALAIAGVLCFTLGVFGSKEEETFTSEIYWNLDRQSMLDPKTGMSMRESAEDGIYYIRFAVGGEVVELPIADGKLANRIDTKDIMCLKFDETGTVVDMVDVEEVYVKIADKVYVQQVTGNSVQANSSQALNGMPIKLEMTDDTCVNYVATRTGTPGDPCAIEPMDQIVVYGLDENTPSAVFITDRFWYSDVYWRVSERMYDATNKCTTRQPAEDGYWYMDWSVNGETVTLRTKKEDVANAWDGYTVNVACCGMVFDEKGDVIDCFNAGLAARGAIMSNNFEITNLAEDGSSFTSTRIMFGTEIGKTYTSVIDENTKIYNVNSTAEVIGEPTELQMDDRVVVIADAMGKAKIVYVTNRMVDSPMYYNVSRSWSSGLKQTQRKPDADGWYNIKLAVKGREVTYRTRDRELVNKIDGYSLSVFGLKVENGIILKAYDAVCVAGNYSFAANNFVDSVDGLMIATSNAAGTAANGVMTADCEVYDVSGHGAFRGVATTVREGDRVLTYKNAPGEINYIYILNRHEVGTTLYWNVNRYYSNGESTRGDAVYQDKPLLDEDGYYHFRVIKVGGTDVTWVKTKDKSIVDRMDSYGTPTAFSLRVNGDGVVTAAYPCAAASGGYQAANYLYVTHADEETEGKWHIKAYTTGATGTFQVADNVQVYDYSQDTYVKGETALPGTVMKGSRTSIRVGDRISCIAGRDGKVHTIMVVEREVAGTTIAIRKSGPASKTVDGKSVLVPDEKGYYNYELLIDGAIKKYKTKDEDLANKISKQSYAFAFKADGDVITNVYNAIASNKILSMAGGAYYDVVSISGGQLTLQRNKPSQTDTGNTTTMKIAYNYKAYTRDTTGGHTYGQQITLKKGDRIFGYYNYNYELELIYVDYKCHQPGGNMAYCKHCGKTVHWESVAAGYSVGKGITETKPVHFYAVTTDLLYSRGPAIATTAKQNDVEIVIKDLESGTILYNDNTQRVWKDAKHLPFMGNWKLGTDVATTASVTVGGELYLDLNGHDITRTVDAKDQAALNGKNLVYSVGANTKLTVVDTSAKDGTVSTVVSDGVTPISNYGVVLHVSAQGEAILKGGIFDGSQVDNLYVNANNGTISVGGKLIVDGATVKGQKRGSANGGAIGGWANTEIIVNSGTIYAGGSFLNNAGNQKVNGAAIATTGKLTINGGKIIGPGKDSTVEQRARSGGLIYANGDSLTIMGGELIDGFGTGYGFNVYYERNYLGTAGEDGKRPSITGGGEVVIGGDAFIKGGVTIRSSKVDDKVKLIVKDNAVIDSTGAVAPTNIRLYNGQLFLNKDKNAATTAPENTNYDISLIYNCQMAPTGFSVGNTTKYEHAYGSDHICDLCGHDKTAPIAWTDKTKLPTSGNYYLDVDVEVSAGVTLSDNLILDLNGHTVTSKVAPVITTGVYQLTVDDNSFKSGSLTGRITTDTITGSCNNGVISVSANGNFILENGIIDGSNVTNTYTGANVGTITVLNDAAGNVGAATINGGKVLGLVSCGNGSAIGMMNLTSLTINGGEIVGNTVTAGVSGAGYGGAIMANGHLTITGGKIYGGNAAVGGDNIFVNNANVNVVISGGEIDGGVQLNNFATATISGEVTIKDGDNYGLKIKSGKVVDFTGLTGGEIYIDADGVFTTNFADADAADAAKKLLKSGDAALKLVVDGTAIKTTALLSVSLSETTVTLTEGEDKTITATVDPAAATVVWTSSDEAVATVVDGKITAVKAGTATITATANYSGIEKTATCTVTVKAPVSSDPIAAQPWVDWTDGNKLPTAGKYKLMTNITVSARAYLTGELWLDLNGYTISSSAAVYDTNGNKLVIDDLSGKTGDQLGTIKTTATSANASGSVIQVGAIADGAAGELILNNGIIDGTTVTNTKANATTGTVAVTNATNSYSSFTMNGGIIKGQKSSVMTSGVGGSALALHNGTTFVMNGGELRAHSAGDFSANVCCTGTCICAGTANITINGGTLVAGRAQNHGGAIYTKGNLTMNGGTIIGGQSQNSGAIYSEGTDVTILGGLIYGGKTVANPGNGGAVDKYKGTVTIGGNAVVLGGVNVRGSAKLILKDAPVIDTSFGLQQRFDIRVNGGSIHLNDASSAAIQSTNGYYSLTYGTDGKVNGVKAFAAVTYTESATLPTSGAVKLTGPVTLTEALVTTGNLYIDLNGQTVTMTGTTYAIKAAHNVVIIDSSAEKTGKIVNSTASLTSDAAVLYIQAGKKAILAGGTLDGSAVTNGFATSYAGTVTVGNDASFIMLGGEVKGQCSASTGSTGKGGGCIGGWGRSNVIIYGGTLTAKNKGTSFPGNAVAAQGSCIATGGNVEIHGGELYGTMATNHGGNIYCTGDLLITGGLISGGYANNSGVIAASGAKCTITGGTIVGGTAHSGSGLGGASVDYAKDGGVLTIGGNAKIAGGVSIRLNAKLVLKDKAVIDMNMAGQTQKKFNIQIKSGNCSIWLNEATGTALASATSGKWDVTYDNAGNITGITAK